MKNQSQQLNTNTTFNSFLWIAVSVGVILLIPAIAMQFTNEVKWKVGDFIVMGGLLFIAFSFAYILWHKVKPKFRMPALLIIALIFLYIWAELAVGVFTDIGN